MVLERLLPGAPSTVWKIIAMEGMERFAYYGFRAILTLFFVRRLGMAESTAVSYFAFTSALAYASPLLGAWLADGLYSTLLLGAFAVGAAFCTQPLARAAWASHVAPLQLWVSLVCLLSLRRRLSCVCCLAAAASLLPMRPLTTCGCACVPRHGAWYAAGERSAGVRAVYDDEAPLCVPRRLRAL